MTKFVPRSAATPAGATNTRSFLNRALSMALPAALLLAAGADAQTLSTRPTSQSGAGRVSPGKAVGTTQVEQKSAPLHTMPAYSAAPVQYRLFDSLLNAFSYYSGGQEPVQWDPASNTLVTIKRGPVGQSDLLFVRTSQDMGMTWSEPKGPLNIATSGLARYPSIKIINKTNSSNPADLIYYFTYPVTTGDAFGTFFQGFLDGNFEPLSPPEANTGVTVDGELIAWSSEARSVVTADGNAVLSAGGMGSNNLGLRKFDLNSGQLTAMIPPQWASENYVDPGSADSRTAVMVGMDRDPSGTLYTGIYSRFESQEVDRRFSPYPAVSMSSDNGATWSAWDILPINVIEAYAESQGANPDSVLFPYNQAQDFTVTGNGSFSFVSNFFEANDDIDAADQVQQIVEVYKNNGQWGIRKIADINGVFTFDPVEPGDERQNQLGNEAQISRTADGTGLIVKWADAISYIFDEDIDGDDETPDTLSTTDIFVAVRKLGSDSWSASDNITETPILDRVSWIPNLVPNDYNNIPMITVQAEVTDDDETIQQQLFTGQLDVANRIQYVFATNFDAGSLAGVSQGGAVTARSGMTLNPAYPNPATAEASISFSLKNSGETTLDVWNVMGERVANLLSGNAEAGDHTAKLQVATLPAGTYYYTLKSGGETLTRMFTVVR